MKLTFLLVLGFVFSLSASVRAQDQIVTLKVKKTPFSKVISELKQQTSLDFFYSFNEVDVNQLISLDVKNMKIDEVLHRMLGERFTWEYVDNMVVIKPLPVGEQEKKSVRVKGFVYDVNKQPLVGVTVKLVGVTLGTATDARGWFALELPLTKGELEFSFVGYEKRVLAFTPETSKDTLRIMMKEDVKAIDEVVVTGYQVLKEKGMAGSYSRVDVKDLAMTGTETLESMLQGKIPGMMVINTSGLTGTRQKVRVRGTATLVGNAETVWVVDGIIQEDNLPFEASELTNMSDNVEMMRDFIGGAISWLNPNDIEDITVLKDASATAIYGVKAANGVILITTKKGERGRMQLNYSANFTASQRMNYNRQEIMNSKERIDLSREAYERGARVANENIGYMGLALAYDRNEISLDEFDAGAKKLELMNTDWFDILYRTPFSQSHTLSFSGGDASATYRASFGYRDVKNTAIGNDQVAYTGSLNTSFIFWNKLTVTASLSGSHTKTKAFASGVDPFSYAINTSRVIACYDDDGELYYYDKGGYKYNILNELANSGNENTSKSLTLNLNARWRVTESLALSATLGGTSSSSFGETWFTERSNYISAIREYEFGEYGPLDLKFQDSRLPYGGMLAVTENRNFNYTARLQAEFVKLFRGVHSVNFMAGLEVRSSQYDGFSQTNWGYQPDRGKSFVDVPAETPNGRLNQTYAATNPTITDRVLNYVSYYATAGYMYDNRYSINLSLRQDGSNRFGDDGKFLPVWSLGLRWNVTDEHWMQDQRLVNNLAFTASFGFQGNVAENVRPELVTRLKAVNSKTGEYQMTWKQLPNPDLKWEKTLSVNLGVNFALFDSKLNGTFNWYHKKTTDVITSARVPFENGTSSMYVNDGDITNRGWDFAFSIVPVRTKDFMWSVGASFSGNTNKVKSDIEPNGKWSNAVSGSLNKEGYSVGSFWAFKFTGLDPSNGEPLFDFSRANTAKAAEDATEYMVYVGSKEPTFTTGINMVFRWKRFSFPLSVYISTGNYEFLNSPYKSGDMMMNEYQNASSELKKRWRKPGDEQFTDIPSIPVGDNCRPLYPFEDGTTKIYPLEAWKYSDARVVKAWYVRFNDIKLSYNLPDKWIKGFAENVTISFTATNPLQIKSKDFKGRDPEVAVGKQPRSQDFSFGLNMSF